MELDAAISLFAGAADKIDTIHHRLTRPHPQPVRKHIAGSALTIASGLGDYALVIVNEFPAEGKIWDLRSLHCYAGPVSAASQLGESSAGSNTVGTFEQTFSTSVAAAAAGTLSVPASYVSAWRIDPAAAWPAGTNQVTITNLNGGTQTYNLPGGTANPLIITYVPPVAAPFGTPVISVPAIVGGPAYTINATGVQLGNSVINSAVDIYLGQPPLTGAPGSQMGPNILEAIRTNLGPLPVHLEFPRRAHTIKSMQSLYAIFAQIPSAGTTVVLVGEVEEWNAEDFEAMEV